MKKKLLLGVIIGLLAFAPVVQAASWKELLGRISLGSIIPVLAYACHTKNAPLAIGYTLGASLTSLGFLFWADSAQQTHQFIEPGTDITGYEYPETSQKELNKIAQNHAQVDMDNSADDFMKKLTNKNK